MEYMQKTSMESGASEEETFLSSKRNVVLRKISSLRLQILPISRKDQSENDC